MKFGIHSALASLSKERSQIDQLADKRRAQSEQAFEQGMRSFNLAKQQSFRDRKLLKQALDAFVQAIRLNRREPLPYAMAGYLAILVRRHPQALVFLKQALVLDPENAYAKEYLKYIQIQSRPNSPGTASLAALSHPDEDPDVLYLQVEQAIAQLLRHSRDYAFDNKPLLKQQDLMAAQKKLELLKRQIDDLAALVEKLDQEIEALDLRLKINPLRSMAKNYASFIKFSFDCFKLEAEIQQEIHKQAKLSLDFKSKLLDGSSSEAQLEATLNRVDLIADKLDSFESQSWNITPLIDSYRELVRQIREFQDILDG